MRFFSLLALGFLCAAAAGADLTGTWRIDMPKRGDVAVRTYFVLQQKGSVLEGKVVVNNSVDRAIRHARLEGDDGLFDLNRNTAYRLHPDGDHLLVTVISNSKESAKAVATRVPAAEANPPARLDLPVIASVPVNGLAQTPPMGWNSWNHFRDRVDDAVVRGAADALVNSGLAEAGYVYINLDDCWEGGRDAQGKIRSNTKFPDMKALADYVHARGLKIGIYSSPGPVTCAGYDGSFGHEEQDAKQYAEWGIDYLKYDWCSAARIYTNDQLQAAYQKMGEALANCGRPIVYSLCEYGIGEVWKWGPQVGANVWRTTGDIQDNWKSMSTIGFSQSRLAPFAAPGHWNDPDMLEIGNGGMTTTEYKTHFSLWSLLAAPLIAGNDLRTMSTDTTEILSNKEVIAIDQDSLGKSAQQIGTRDGFEFWMRPLYDGSAAIGVFNRNDEEKEISFTWRETGLARPPQTVRDLWAHRDLTRLTETWSSRIPAHGVLLLKASGL